MDPHPCLYVCKAMPNCTEKVINRNKKRKQEVGREMGRGAIGAIFWKEIIEYDMKWVKIHKNFNK